jgi:cytochrome c553
LHSNAPTAVPRLLPALVALCGSALLALATVPARAQDAKAGETKAAQCIGCHSIPGYQASFPEVHKVPMIAGQSAKYLVAALGEYKKGDRKHPTMRSIGESLSEQDMADLAAYYEGLGKTAGATPPPATPAAPPADVQALLGKMNCASCHGANFSSPIDPSYPKLAGQHADYLYVALKAYQTDRATVGRGNAIMKGMVAPYTHAELKKIAQYLGSLPGELKVVPQSRFKR